jgi:hypothetical protein
MIVEQELENDGIEPTLHLSIHKYNFSTDIIIQ